MRKNSFLFFLFTVMLAGLAMNAAAGKNGIRPTALDVNAARRQPLPGFDTANSPLYFISNQGQVNRTARFYARTSDYTLWMTPAGMVFERIRRDTAGQTGGQRSMDRSSWRVDYKREVSQFIFLQANRNLKMIPLRETPLKVNYFKGNDPSRWFPAVPTCEAVLYKDLYRDIDLQVYGIRQQVEYDWRVKPGGNPGKIRFRYRGAGSTRFDDRGNLVIETPWGNWVHKKPVAYQFPLLWKRVPSAQRDRCPLLVKFNLWGLPFPLHIIKFFLVPVEVNFKEEGRNTYGFDVGTYDRKSELIIDPVVVAYSTYLGGNMWEEGYAIAQDSSGYTYVTGATWSTNFPLRNHYQSDPGSDNLDVFVTRLDTAKTGSSSLVYSTYLGGVEFESGNGIAVDNSGNVVVSGYTFSDDFPVKNQYQDYKGEGDVFVVRLDTNASGAASLLFSTCLGGEQSERAEAVALDKSGNVYITGWTYGADFPVKNAFQPELKEGSTDGFVTKLHLNGNGTASLLYSTYLGGAKSEGCSGIAADNSGNAYITGWTYSPDFPGKNSYKAYQKLADAFLTKIDTTGSGSASLLYSTCLGGGDSDYGEGVALDSSDSGIAYIAGITRSSNFPTRNPFQGNQSGDDAFVAKFDTTGSGSASLLYSTYLGGSGADQGHAIAASLEESGIVYVTGSTASANFPSQGSYQSFQGGEDAFVTGLDTARSGSSSLLFSTHLGGTKSDGGSGVAVDGSGNIYLTGWTLSTGFPTVNPYRADPGDSDFDAFVTRLVIEADQPPSLQLSRTALGFSAVIGGAHTGAQSFIIENSGQGALDWTAALSASWLELDPQSGAGGTIVYVSVEPMGLNPGNFTGTITLTDPDADNSPQTVTVNLTVYKGGSTASPFGEFSTPLQGANVSSSIPVTGWVLDDVGIAGVKIYRAEGKSLVYIGDGVFVEGARPDIEAAYPGYPMNYRAGWGYMMLTHFLPGGGNGTYTIHAVASDLEGHQVTLGSKTITVDNANAIKPFGAIDTPGQGGLAAGSGFVNWGWVLTPQPNTIPTDGSTLNVWVDGVLLGHPVYNINRSDLAQLFPDYNNSTGAAGYFYLDTTAYSNGVHTIQWTAKDDAGNNDGIGSRYFTIQNAAGSTGSQAQNRERLSGRAFVYPSNSKFESVPGAQTSTVNGLKGLVMVRKGFNPSSLPQQVRPDDQGNIKIDIRELQRVEIQLGDPASRSSRGSWLGFQVRGTRLGALPAGSTLDRQRGIFYWQPGPGFLGHYRLEFLREPSNGSPARQRITITILPRD